MLPFSVRKARHDHWYIANPGGKYSKFKEIVPQSIQLSAVTVAHWLMDDGCLKVREYSDRMAFMSITFCTHSFGFEDCRILATQQRDQQITTIVNLTPGSVMDYYHIIKIHRRASYEKLAKMIRPFVCKAMEYKINLVKRTMPQLNATNRAEDISIYSCYYTTHKTHCYICDLAVLEPRDHHQNNHYKLLSCLTCGFVPTSKLTNNHQHGSTWAKKASAFCTTCGLPMPHDYLLRKVHHQLHDFLNGKFSKYGV